MARPVSMGELVTRAQQLADMEGSSFISASEWRTYANRHITQLWDMLVDAGPADYYSSDWSFTVQEGVRAYSLPGDFRSLLRILQSTSGSKSKAVLPLRAEERSYASDPAKSFSVTVEYVPTPPVLTADTQVIDGISGWEDLIAAGMAREALTKEESDTSAVQNIIDREAARIESYAAYRDRGPRFVGYETRQDEVDRSIWADSDNRSDALRYRLRGGILEFFSL